MQYISIYDRLGETADQILSMDLWKERPDFTVNQEILKKAETILQELADIRPDILILINDRNIENMIGDIHKNFSGMNLIVIGEKSDYETVRYYFLSGVFDYLVSPPDTEMLKQSILRVYADFGAAYVVNKLSMKTDALIGHIFQGGGREEEIIRNIIEQIYLDWKEDPLHCQSVCDKAKRHIYESLIERKPWLEKFLYRNDFTYRSGFSFRNRDENINEWIRCFKEASDLVKKYQMIDDKLVYRIGKYIVVHVDEKMSLKDVAEGVFLNPSYMSHIFKKITGMSLSDFTIEVKSDRAKVLLREKNMRIRDVAAAIGYANPEYFAKRFRDNTGYTPVQYRKLLDRKKKLRQTERSRWK